MHTFTYSYNAVVAASAQGSSPAPLVNTACFDANSDDQPDVVFHGCDPRDRRRSARAAGA